MRCTEAKPLFSSYLDGAVSGVEMHEVSNHLSECAVCESEYAMLEKSRALVSSLGRRPAPPNLPCSCESHWPVSGQRAGAMCCGVTLCAWKT